MGYRLVYNTKRYKFTTPEELSDKMMEYMAFAKKCNEPQVRRFCDGVLMTEPGEVCKGELITDVKDVPSWDIYRPTLFGLCAFLGISKQTFWRYGNKTEGEPEDLKFSEVVNWFRTILEGDLEQILLNPFSKNINGPKLVATNNYGWTDRKEIEHKGAQPVTILDDIPVEKE